MAATKNLIIYDVCSIPDGLSMTQVAEAKEKFGIVVYDSFKGKEPFVLDNEANLQTVDYSKLTKQQKEEYGL